MPKRRSRKAAPGTLQPGVADVLGVLRSIWVLLNEDDGVVACSPSAIAHGIVRKKRVVHPPLRELAKKVRKSSRVRDVSLELSRGPLGGGRMYVNVRAGRLQSGHVLLLMEDLTMAARVDEIRRDFVANVSHELKTPVGGLALLAEAVHDGADDPAAVQRFAGRMRVEADRLTTLVQEIVDLSRLQVADTVDDPVLVDLDAAVDTAIDRCRLLSERRQVELKVNHSGDAFVYGESELLTTAIRNLVENAIHYSDPGTKVTISVRHRDETVEISVRDRGQGIALGEQERIFERFYRIDPARSRATGGTGLGLAIVKHVCANHGGQVRVNSEPGHGSTFTIVLPEARDVDHEVLLPEPKGA